MEYRASHHDDPATSTNNKGKRALPLPSTQGDEDFKRRKEVKSETEEQAFLKAELEDHSPPLQLSTLDFFQNREVDRPEYRLVLQKNAMNNIDPLASPHGMRMQGVQTQQNTRGPFLEHGSMPLEEVQQIETAPLQNVVVSDHHACLHGVRQAEVEATGRLAPSENTDHVGRNIAEGIGGGDRNSQHLDWESAVRQNARCHRWRRYYFQQSAKKNAHRLAARAKSSDPAAVDQGPQLAQPPHWQPGAGAIISPAGSAASQTTGKAPIYIDVNSLIGIAGSAVSIKRPLCPSLGDLCADLIADNVNAIVSLASVPDIPKARICKALCDKGRMTSKMLSLAFAGSKPALIEIPDCSLITEAELAEFFCNFDPCDLRVLHLRFCGVSVSKQSLSVLNASCRRSQKHLLTSLTLSGAWKLADDCLADLLLVYPELKRLDLSQCMGLTDAAVEFISCLVGNTLESLVLDDCNILDATLLISSLISLKRLHKLSLAGITCVTDEVVEQVSIHLGPNLKELILANCGSLSDKAMVAIGTCCPSLEVLSLKDNISLTDVGLASVRNGCQTLEVLLLMRCRFSGEAVASFIAASGHRLRRLSLNGLTEVTDEVLLALARHSNGFLEQLDASWCRQLSDKGLSTLADCCPRLSSLKLFGCTQVTRSFIRGYQSNRSNSRSLKIYI